MGGINIGSSCSSLIADKKILNLTTIQIIILSFMDSNVIIDPPGCRFAREVFVAAGHNDSEVKIVLNYSTGTKYRKITLLFCDDALRYR